MYTKLSPLSDPRIWSQLHYFNVGEAWGSPEKMDLRLLWGLDRVRNDLCRSITINCGHGTSGHVDGSFHGLGMAADIVIAPFSEDVVDDLYTLYLTVLSMWHGGVGVYPFWNDPGLHLDIGPDRTWVRDKEGVYHSGHDKIREIVLSAVNRQRGGKETNKV